MKVGEFELVDPVPEVNNTVAISMLRPWIDVGRVGTLSLRKLEQYLGAKELGRLATPGKFAAPLRGSARRLEEPRLV